MEFPQIPIGFTRNFEKEVFEDELIEQELPSPTFEWVDSSKHPLKTKVLIVATQGAPSCFLHSIFPEKKAIANIILPEIKKQKVISSKFRDIREEESKIWDVGHDTLILTLQYQILEDRCWAWVDTLFKNISTQKIIVLDTLFLARYQSLKSVQTPFIRKVSTSGFNLNDNINLLEPPNACEKISATLLTFSEIKKISTVVYLSISEEDLSFLSLKGFEDILKKNFDWISFGNEKEQKEKYKFFVKQLPIRKPDHIYL